MSSVTSRLRARKRPSRPNRPWRLRLCRRPSRAPWLAAVDHRRPGLPRAAVSVELSAACPLRLERSNVDSEGHHLPVRESGLCNCKRTLRKLRTARAFAMRSCDTEKELRVVVPPSISLPRSSPLRYPIRTLVPHFPHTRTERSESETRLQTRPPSSAGAAPRVTSGRSCCRLCCRMCCRV